MRIALRHLVLFVLLSAAALAQAPKPKLSDFAGRWTAQFHKQTWLTLSLESAGDALVGTLEHATYLSSDNDGNLTNVGDEMSMDKVVDAELQDGKLLVSTRDAEGNVDRYTLRLSGPNAAELQPITENGEPAPKAFQLKREVRAAQK